MQNMTPVKHKATSGAEAIIALWNQLRSAGLIERSDAVLRQGLSEFPECVDIFEHALLDLGQEAEIGQGLIGSWKVLLAAHPSREAGWRELAILLAKMGLFVECEAVLTQSKRVLEPEVLTQNIAFLSLFFLKAGEGVRAEAMLRAEIASAPTSSAVWSALIQVVKTHGSADAYRQVLRQASEAIPDTFAVTHEFSAESPKDSAVSADATEVPGAPVSEGAKLPQVRAEAAQIPSMLPAPPHTSQMSQSAFSQILSTALRDPFIFDIDYVRFHSEVKESDTDLLAKYIENPMQQASPYFDPVWYTSTHGIKSPDKLASHAHYFAEGRAAGLATSPIFNGRNIEVSPSELAQLFEDQGVFDPKWYEYRHRDIARAGIVPLSHYSKHGHREHTRLPHVLFDTKTYLASAPDVARYGWNPLHHYLTIGAARRISPHIMLDEPYVALYCKPGQTPLSMFSVNVPDSERVIGPNEYFDFKFYIRSCPESIEHPGGPMGHYLDVGWKSDLRPSDRFDGRNYLLANTDVSKKKRNPLAHFLQSGRAEGRHPLPQESVIVPATKRFGAPEYGGAGHPLIFDADIRLPEGFCQSIAVHLHLYYTEMAAEFAEYLLNIPIYFTLLISVPEGRGDAAPIESLFKSALPNCRAVIVAQPPNRGRDIAPFLITFGRQILNFDLVLHLHSKRSPHSSDHRDWRRYLLHYTLGSRAVVTQILTAFHVSPQIGIFQPPYHPQLRAQPKWGENQQRVVTLLRQLGYLYGGNFCPDFPAGSFFWARTDALRPLFEDRISLDDFEAEAGQIDGTTAHAAERLLGLLPVLRGKAVEIRYTDVAHNLINYYNKVRLYSGFDRDRSAEILAYQAAAMQRAGRRARVAVVTAITGGFDALLLPEILDSDIDYFCVSDCIHDGYGVFRILPPSYIDADPRRTARYIKTNLLRLFPGYHYVVWIDANVLARTSIMNFVLATERARADIGAINHPLRRSYTDEAEVVLSMKLDDGPVIEEQMSVYREIAGVANVDLIETNVMVFDGRSAKASLFQRLWWNEINKYSRRDQLSIGYCIHASGVTTHSLLPDLMSTRDSPHFALFQHGLADYGPQPHIYSRWYEPHSADGTLSPLAQSKPYAPAVWDYGLSVVVCVHNALDDVKECLQSVLVGLQGRGEIILVDDSSDDDTASYLREFAGMHGARLVRHDERSGYTVSANAGVRASTRKHVLLLNSDTIVPRRVFFKLVDAFNRDPLLGIIGPLSNAASFQSVPSTVGTSAQTAINGVPNGMTVEDMDRFLEQRWDGTVIETPLVHGFCFCVKRDVFDRIGMFDELAFPLGYGEENDFCFRAADAGFRLGVLPSSYVYHAKSKSYVSTEREKLMASGMQNLKTRHGTARIQRSVESMRAHPKLVAVRDCVVPLFEARGASATPSSPEAKRKLLLVPARRSDNLPTGSAFVRVLLPYRSEAVAFEWDVIEHDLPSIPDIRGVECVVVQRDGFAIPTEDLAAWLGQVQEAGVRLIYEIDDDLLDAQALKARGYQGNADELPWRVMQFATAADCVTVSSVTLQTKFSAINRNVVLVPNVLDPGVWKLRDGAPAHVGSKRPAQGSKIVIGYVGTPTHDDDLKVIQPAMEILSRRYPGRLDIQIVGGVSTPQPPFGRKIPLPSPSDYPSFCRWLQTTLRWDIGLAPLANSKFNDNKSYLKFLECAALGMAVVCSDAAEYRRVVQHNETGFLVRNTTEEWVDTLCKLIDDRELRSSITENSIRAVKDHHTVANLRSILSDVLS